MLSPTSIVTGVSSPILPYCCPRVKTHHPMRGERALPSHNLLLWCLQMQTESKPLLEACSKAERIIQDVVLMDGDSDQPEPVTDLADYNDHVYKFFCDTEASFRGRVKVQHIQDEVDDVQVL